MDIVELVSKCMFFFIDDLFCLSHFLQTKKGIIKMA